MLQNSYFYYNTTRKLVNVFGDMFNDIIVRRLDQTTNTVKNIPVSIEYAGKQKYIRLNARKDENEIIQTTLPRIGFIITNLRFESARKIDPINRLYKKQSSSSLNTQFVPIPMSIDMQLQIMVRSEDDGFQIVEQIIPYFHPSFTNNIKLFPDMGLEYDCRTIWDGNLSLQDLYEGTPEDSRFLTFQMNFTMQTWYSGPFQNSGLIKRVQVDLIPTEDVENSENVPQSRIVVTPGLTVDRQPTEDPTMTIPYSEINADDPYGYITEISFYQDGVHR